MHKCYDNYGGHHEQNIKTNHVLVTAHRGDPLCPVPQPVRARHLLNEPRLLGNDPRAVHASYPVHSACNSDRIGVALGMDRRIDLRRVVHLLPCYHTWVPLERLCHHRRSPIRDRHPFPPGLDLPQRDTHRLKKFSSRPNAYCGCCRC